MSALLCELLAASAAHQPVAPTGPLSDYRDRDVLGCCPACGGDGVLHLGVREVDCTECGGWGFLLRPGVLA